MTKILSIDYGLKRTGLAYAEEPLFIALSLTTVKTNEIFKFLSNYLKTNDVVKIIIGEPKSLDGSFTDSTKVIHNFHKKITKLYSKIKVELYDERFTSKIAKHVLFSSDLKKNKRKNKEYLDKISAVIILQDYLKSEGLS
ncbi:MAG: Holliday junction resolvase RuvX [Bacteroidetes bacterium MED-G20]|nr:MAG: Holliday junction resolvase RuvX [Bacteroidetes bacterium MED-G20]|tara:strand:+ start:136 stop:555 length:420 start_codon:yes stop_codon:yes gene_type:complete